MKKFLIVIQDSAEYEIKADTEEQAIEQAYQYWLERDPDIFVEDEQEV